MLMADVCVGKRLHQDNIFIKLNKIVYNGKSLDKRLKMDEWMDGKSIWEPTSGDHV